MFIQVLALVLRFHDPMTTQRKLERGPSPNFNKKNKEEPMLAPKEAEDMEKERGDDGSELAFFGIPIELAFWYPSGLAFLRFF